MSNPVLKSVRSREPLFGSGAGSFFGQLLTLAAALALILLVATLGRTAFSTIRTTLFGEPERSAPVLQPGESTVINGVTIKRIN